MRKIIVAITIIALFFSVMNVQNVYAANEENFSDVYTNEAEDEQIIVLDSCEGLNVAQFEEENNRLFSLGKQLQNRRQNTICALASFPTLYQGDEAWKDCIMLTRGRTIGAAGCCLTSFTMIQQYYGGTDTPDLVNTRMGNYACDFYYYEAADIFDYTITSCIMKDSDEAPVSYEDMVDYVWAAIWEGHPVLIGMRHETENTHFVVAYGYAYDYIFIKDPAQSRNKTYLSEYMDLGYEIHRVIIYEN